MKFSKIKLAMLGLAVLFSVGSAGLRAEEEVGNNDQKVRMEALEEAVEGLIKKTEELSMMYIEGFADIRYDDERVPNTLTGTAGVFVRRAEIKMNGNVKNMNSIVWSMGYDFTESKMKDMGIEVKDIHIIPCLDIAPEYTWSIRFGQYRIPFGIIPQTSSSSINFAERPIIFGGKQAQFSQFGAAVSSQLVKERVMGLQLRTMKKFDNIIGYDLQLGAFNDASSDQAVGQNRILTGFPTVLNDQYFSMTSRLALTWDFLNRILPEKSKFQTGGSFVFDSKNAVYNNPTLNQQSHDEIVGAELLLSLANNMAFVQSEYVRSQNAINGGTPLPAGSGAIRQIEGWYVEGGFDFIPLFVNVADIAKGDAVQLLLRAEEENIFNNANIAFAPSALTRKTSRLSGGLKWSYGGGKNHTAINYMVTGPDGMYGGDFRDPLDGGTGMNAPETMLIIQQQFSFETGKPK